MRAHVTHLGPISQDINSQNKFENIFVTLPPYLPGANELKSVCLMLRIAFISTSYIWENNSISKIEWQMHNMPKWTEELE